MITGIPFYSGSPATQHIIVLAGLLLKIGLNSEKRKCKQPDRIETAWVIESKIAGITDGAFLFTYALCEEKTIKNPYYNKHMGFDIG